MATNYTCLGYVHTLSVLPIMENTHSPDLGTYISSKECHYKSWAWVMRLAVPITTPSCTFSLRPVASPAFSFGSFGEAHWVCKSESWVQIFNTRISLLLQMTVRNDMGGPTWVASMHGTEPVNRSDEAWESNKLSKQKVKPTNHYYIKDIFTCYVSSPLKSLTQVSAVRWISRNCPSSQKLFI